jgi:hypothetical protein
MKHGWVGALVLTVAVLVSGSALAQEPGTDGALAASDEAIDAAIEAKKRYAAGQKSVAQRQFVEAALHFEAAHSFSPSGVSLISAAIAWESANYPQRAADAYARALEEPGLRKTQINHAKARLEALERSIATVVVSGEEGVRVQLDDNVDVTVPARLHGSPGLHRLAVWSKGKIVGRRDVFLRLGRPESVTVPWHEDVAPPPPPPPPPAPVAVAPPPQPSPWKVVGGGLVGAGIASAAGGLLLQLSANDAGGDIGQTYAVASWIAAGTFLAGGISILLWPRGSEKPPMAISPAANGAVLRSAF